MIIELRSKESNLISKASSKRDLLIQKSLIEQRLEEARRCLVSWSLEASVRQQECLSYLRRIQELWYSGEWNESHFNKLESRTREAFHNKGTYMGMVEVLERELEKIKTEIGCKEIM